MGNVKTKLDEVNGAISAAARAAGRDGDAVKLVAVSKTFGPEPIEEAIAAGQRCFGENRVQEAQSKWPALKARYSDLELHLIGPLQSNKAKDAVVLFDVIETVDREKIARAIAAALAVANKPLRLLVQVNTGEEEQKAGVKPNETAAFVTRCREEFGLEIDGLMCIPPMDQEPAFHFALLAKLARESGLAELSMGMSADYESAIGHGATLVRVGTGVFGQRGPR